MLSKLIIVGLVLTMGYSAQAQDATPKKKSKKTITTTTVTEEVDDEGSLYKDPKNNDPKESNVEEARPSSRGDLPTANEDWYTLWGLGFSKGSYSGEVGTEFENNESIAGVDRTTFNMDILGFYWPLESHKTMLGVIYNATRDSLKLGGETYALNTHLLAFSTHHFFGKNIGDGWFLRGDIGFSRVSMDFTSGALTAKAESDAAIGIMFGGGYGFAIGEETRLLLGLYIKPIPKMEFDSGATVKGTVTNLTVGFLF